MEDNFGLLFKEMKNNKAALTDTLELVSKLIKNICDDPSEDKFKTIKTVLYLFQNLSWEL